MRQYILRHHRASGDHRPLTNTDAVGDHRAGTDPDVVFNHNALGRDPLFHEWAFGVIENVVHGNNLHQRRGVDTVTNSHTALTTDHVHLADQAVRTNPDT